APRKPMHGESVRLGESGPHLTELAVAAHRELVARREEIAQHRFECAATGRMHGKRLAFGSKDWREELDRRRKLAREFRRSVMDHGPRPRAPNALGHPRRPRRHEQQTVRSEIAFHHSITPFLRSRSSISDLYRAPFLISSMRARSRAMSAATRVSTSAT